MIKIDKSQKTILSLASVGILLLIILLLPKNGAKQAIQEPPRTAVRFVPAPTPTPTEELVVVQSQTPGNTMKISSVKAVNQSYLVVEHDGEILYTSEMFAETLNNLEIPLGKEVTEREVLTIKLFEENEKLIYEKEVLFTATALTPGIILPKDLQ